MNILFNRSRSLVGLLCEIVMFVTADSKVTFTLYIEYLKWLHNNKVQMNERETLGYPYLFLQILICKTH